MNCFCQQPLDITARILDAMEGAFDMLTDAAQETVKFGWILERLVGPFTCPDAVTGVLTHLGLPLVANKALVAEEVAIFDPFKTTSAASRSSVLALTKS